MNAPSIREERAGDDGRRWIAAGAVLAMLAIATGAFAAHGLRGRLSVEALAVFETAARYQMFHALALVACGVAAPRLRPGPLRWSAGLFMAGIVLFSGSLYGLALSGWRPLGVVTPVGGTAWIVAWLLLALASRRQTAQ